VEIAAKTGNSPRKIKTISGVAPISAPATSWTLAGQIENALWLELALAHFADRNQRPEAKTVAQPVCATTAPALTPMRELLAKAQLCEK
jgi:hypothetical protein